MLVAEKMAEILNCRTEEVADFTTENALKIFNLNESDF